MTVFRIDTKKLILFFFSLIFSLLALEIGIRLFQEDQRPRRPAVYSNNPQNTYGFRDYDYAKEKSPGCFRIIGMGDSFTWGHGVDLDDIFLKRLERRLQRRYGKEKIEVLNFARRGDSTHQELDRLKKIIPDFSPDLVIIGFCLNDAEDHRDMGAFERYRSFVFRRPPSGIQNTLCGISALYSLIYWRIENTRVRRAHIRYYHQIYRDDYPGYPLCLKSIWLIGYLLHEEKIPGLLVIFPLFHVPLDENYPFVKEHEKVRIEAEQSNLLVLDLLPLYRNCDGNNLMVDPPEDVHPNEIAHRMAAEEIAKALDDLHLLPDPPDLLD